MADQKHRSMLPAILILVGVLVVLWFPFSAWLWVVGGIVGLLWATWVSFAKDWRQSSRKDDFSVPAPDRLDKEN